MSIIQTILHPTDFSESAHHAFRLACSLARDHEANVVVLHVSPHPFLAVGEMMAVPFAGDLSEEEQQEMMEKMRAGDVEHADVPIEYRLRKGDVIDTILAEAEAVGAGLIVMGTHGRSGLEPFLVGSIAESVVRRSACPVLTVKTPFTVQSTRYAYPDRPLMATPY